MSSPAYVPILGPLVPFHIALHISNTVFFFHLLSVITHGLHSVVFHKRTMKYSIFKKVYIRIKPYNCVINTCTFRTKITVHMTEYRQEVLVFCNFTQISWQRKKLPPLFGMEKWRMSAELGHIDLFGLWKVNGDREKIMKRIDSLRSQTMYPHPPEDCTEDCKKRGTKTTYIITYISCRIISQPITVRHCTFSGKFGVDNNIAIEHTLLCNVMASTKAALYRWSYYI